MSKETQKTTSLITDEIRASASELYHGHDICSEKSKFLLTEVGLPNGLLPLQDIEECGYVKDTGFVWLIQKKKCEHMFEKIGKPVQYAREVTAYAEPNKIKKLTGVKAKELLIWINLSEISVDDPPTGKITFKTPAGLFRTFPTSAFEIEGVEKPQKLGLLDGKVEPAPATGEVEVEVEVEVEKDGGEANVAAPVGVNAAAPVEVKEA